MRWIVAVLWSLLQTPAPLPPAYPRPGATKVLENSRVQVWDIAWLKQPYPLHRHIYDLVGIYYAPGDRTIISVDGTRRPVTTNAWDTVFLKAGVTHGEEGASDLPLRAVFVELKEAAPLGEVDMGATPAPFPQSGGKLILDNERTTLWEFVPKPVETGSPHRHQRDAVVVLFDGPTPHVIYTPRGTVHKAEGTGRADRAYVAELK